MKKIVVLILLLLVIAQSAGAQEELSIVTYYPTPYGVYSILQLYPMADGGPTSSNCSNPGEMYFESTTQSLYICSGTPSIWRLVPGLEPAIPPGIILMFAGNCPAGWSNYAPLNNVPNRFPRGTTGATGATGGGLFSTLTTSMSDQHQHTQTAGSAIESYTVGDPCGNLSGLAESGILTDEGGSHNHTVGIDFSDNASMPPYELLRFCSKD